MEFYVQEYSFIKKDWISAKEFKKGIGGGQRIVVEDEQIAIALFNEFVDAQKGKGYAEYRLIKSWLENFRYPKRKIITQKTQK